MAGEVNVLATVDNIKSLVVSDYNSNVTLRAAINASVNEFKEVRSTAYENLVNGHPGLKKALTCVAVAAGVGGAALLITKVSQTKALMSIAKTGGGK